MAAKKVSMEGTASAKRGASGGPRDNTKHATFWTSYRGGPFLIHKVGKCEPQTNDNAGYLDDLDTAIEQGFAPCPKCIK